MREQSPKPHASVISSPGTVIVRIFVMKCIILLHHILQNEIVHNQFTEMEFFYSTFTV